MCEQCEAFTKKIFMKVIEECWCFGNNSYLTNGADVERYIRVIPYERQFEFMKLEYRLSNGNIVKFLDDNATYLGNQLPCEFGGGGDRCFGIAANMDFLLVCTYEENGENPELVVYKKR